MTEYINHSNRLISQPLALLLAIILCLTITACSNQTPQESKAFSYSAEELTAQEQFRQSLPIDPYLLQNYPELDADSQSQYQQALNFINEKKWAKAQRVLINLTKNQPDLSAPYLQLAIINRRLGDNELANKNALKALSINQYNYPAYMFIAERLQEQGLFVEATQQYTKIIELWPGYAEAYYHLARVEDLYLGKIEAAYNNYQRYLSLHGKDPLVEAWLINLKARM